FGEGSGAAIAHATPLFYIESGQTEKSIFLVAHRKDPPPRNGPRRYLASLLQPQTVRTGEIHGGATRLLKFQSGDLNKNGITPEVSQLHDSLAMEKKTK
uniref:Uncharacterized protein n=1 Tax=Xenopus tropicalis TaxID=8364 RepID=A0A803J9N2_XENTR